MRLSIDIPVGWQHIMNKQKRTPRSGDRNDLNVADKDERLQLERDKQNREASHSADRADEQGTRNSEAKSPGSG